MIYWLTLGTALLITLALTPLAGAWGRRVGLVDRPGGRRLHQGVIPRTGGLAIFGGFVLTVALTLLLPAVLPTLLSTFLAEDLTIWLPPRNDPQEDRRLAALLAGGVFCVVAGYLDDRYELGSLPQYLFQIVAALIAIAGLIFIKHVNNPLGEGLLFGPDGLPMWLVIPVTIFWFMGMMNTINWLDGLSGLVGGVSAILGTVLAVHMLFAADPPQQSVALLPMALIGTALGFLWFNFAPARIFMGSAGSYFLGYTLAALGIIGGARLATVMLVLGLPALDVAWLIISRWRRGISPSQGGRDHLHFRLLDLGLAERTIVLLYWGFCAVFGALTLLLDDRVYKIVALGGLGIVALGLLYWVSRLGPASVSASPTGRATESEDSAA